MTARGEGRTLEEGPPGRDLAGLLKGAGLVQIPGKRATFQRNETANYY